jgi:hypothetical protein
VASYYTEETRGQGTDPAIDHSEVFLQRLREQLEAAHSEWNTKIEKLKESIASFGTDNDSFSQPDAAVFEELLMLFATNCNNSHLGRFVPTDKEKEGRSSSSELRTHLLEGGPQSDGSGSDSPGSEINTKNTMLRLFAKHPQTLQFYIPQLVVYLLYGHAPTSAELREALLVICAQSAVFALRIFYFIEAYCIAGAGVSAEGVCVLQQLLRSIEGAALPAAERIASGHGRGETGPAPSDRDDACFGPDAPQLYILDDDCGPRGERDVEAPPPPS